MRVLGNKTIVTNGDQTDTIYDGMDHQMTFEQSLRCREFEPDAPNYTPRISGIMHIENGNYNYAMSILKSDNGNPDSCLRFTYAYPVSYTHLDVYKRQVQKQIADMGFQVSSQADWMESTKQQSSMIQAVLGGIGAVSLFVAAIGIANTCLLYTSRCV